MFWEKLGQETEITNNLKENTGYKKIGVNNRLDESPLWNEVIKTPGNNQFSGLLMNWITKVQKLIIADSRGEITTTLEDCENDQLKLFDQLTRNLVFLCLGIQNIIVFLRNGIHTCDIMCLLAYHCNYNCFHLTRFSK